MSTWWNWSGVAWHWVIYVLAAVVLVAFVGAVLYYRDPPEEVLKFEAELDAIDPTITTDLPGPGISQLDQHGPGLGSFHERTVTRDVWDEWWAGMDGLDRECLLVTRWRHREEGLWAALVAETRELCAA